MPFDIDAARSAGYSDDEIVDFLRQRDDAPMDVAGALGAGYSPTEIVKELGSKSKVEMANRRKELGVMADVPAVDPEQQANQGVDINAGLGPMRQDYVNQTRSDLKQQPLAQQVAAAQGNDQKAKIAAEVAKANALRSRRIAAGNLLPQSPQEVADDAAVVTPPAPKQPEEPAGDTIGLAESMKRAVMEEVGQTGKYAGLALSAPVAVYAALHQAITGNEDQPLRDAAFKLLVDPSQRVIDANSIKPGERQNFAEKVVSGIGAFLVDLPMMLVSAQGAAPAKAATSINQYLGQALERGFIAMRPIMLKSAGEKVDQVIAHGGTVAEAINAGTTAALLTGATGAAPMSLEGTFLKRLATGMPVGAVISEINRQTQNIAMPDDLKTPFSAEGVAVGAVTGGILAGAAGHRAPEPAPTRTEQGYFTRTPMADAAHQLALDPARPAPTDVLHAQSIDEAIQTAKASLKPITVPTAEAPAVSPVVAQLKAIRPLPEPKVDPVARLAELEQAATDPNRVLSPDELTERDTLRMQDTVQKERDAAQTEIDKTVKGDPAASVDEAGATQYRGAPLVAVAKEALPDHSATEGNALSRQQAEVIDSLLRIGGQHLVIYDNHPNLPDGFVHPNSPDTVFLARNTSRAPEVVAIHEFNHIMERTAPEVHQAYLDTIREELKPGALAEARKQHGDLPEERLLREIGADIAGNAATSTKFMFRVVSKLRARFGDTAAQPMVKSLIDAVAGHLARVRELVKGGIFNKQGKATDVANAYVKDLEKVHNALADVYAEHFQQSHVEAGKAEAAKPEGIKAEVASIKQAKQQAATPAIASDAALPAAKQPQKKAPGQEPLLSAKREEKELPAPFYSQLSRSLDKAPPKLDNAPAVQWTAWINSNAAKMGVKADEIKWSGINEYLAMQGKNKLTRSQIQDYLKANGVQLKEVTKGEQAFEANERIDDARHAVSVANDLVDIAIHNALNHMRNAGASTEDVTQAYHAFLYNTPDRDSETLDKAYALLKKSAPAGYNLDTIKNAIADKNKAKEAYQEAVANVVPEPQYADFVLPGGRNYQELLLTLPEREPSFAIDDYIGQLDAKYGVKRVGQVSTSAWSVSDLTAAEQAKLKALQQATRAETERNRVFQSSHWEQPNVLAHIRFNERLDADGKRVLFVEELQSDWAAAGRKKGFRTPEFLQAEQALADFNEENKALVREKLVQRYMKKGLDQERAGRQADYELKTWSGYGYAEFLGRENEYMALQEPIKYQDTVPEGPFVTETKAWLALTIKRMIRYAAEHGYDRVAFVNGEQSADRYSLRKKVSRVTVKPFRAERGEYTLEAYDYADDVSFKKHMQLSDLDEYIGQELADKARQHVTEHGHADLKGVDLKVGGEGMKGFYDQIVPNVTREVLKKLGGGKLITSRIDTQGSGLQAKYEYIGPDYAPAVLTRSDMLARVDNAQLERQLREVARGLRGGQTFAEAMAEHGSISLAEKIGGKMVEKESVPNDQTAFDVTPAMREQALQGQPLFSPKRDQTETPEFKRWFGNSKVVDQSGKPLPMYHGTSKAGFDHFDTYASNYGLMGMGGYFTDNPQVASGYSKKAGGTAPGVYKTYLQIKNPLDMDAPADPDAWRAQFEDIDNYHEGGDTNEAWYRAAEQSLADQELPKWEGAEIMQNALRAMGHDGITHVGGGRVAADSVQHRVYIAFDPEQIKSATGNNGQFDPANPDISMSRQRKDEPPKEPTRILFEVAPDPNNAALVARWDALKDADKYDVSNAVAEKMIPKMLRLIGAKGEMTPQYGGYKGVTNPSFAINLDPRTSARKIIDAAKLSGYMLRQDSTMVVSEKPIPGADKVDLLVVHLPKDASPQLISDVYQKLYEINDGILEGHTTVNGKMAIVDFTRQRDLLAPLIFEKLNGQYAVETNDGYAIFVDKKDYGYETDNHSSSTGHPAGRRSPIQDAAHYLQSEASRLLAGELDAREGSSAGAKFSEPRDGSGDGRSGVDGEGEQTDLRQPARPMARYGKATPHAISIEAVHYSPVPQTILNSARYGTGLRGAERERVMNAADTRLRNRTFFYVNEGQGVFPEQGVGNVPHGVRLDNLYDAVADPLNLYSLDTAAFEKSVIDRGFDGVYVRGGFNRQGAVIILGRHEIPVARLQPGELTAVAPKPTLTPYRKLQDDLQKDKRLPGGQMRIAKIERLAPDLYQRLQQSGVLDRLKPDEPYYASEIAALIPPDGVQDSRPRINYTGPGAKIVNATQDAIGNLLDDALLKVSPMVLGSAPARALAKTFANADRLARWQWGKFDDVLRKNFTPDQRREMWEAADEENVLRQQEAADPQFIRPANAGLARLTPEQRQTMDTLQQYGEQLLQRARDVGMFDGDGLPYWTPRIAVMIDGSGDYVRMPGAGQQATSSGVGGNMTATSPNLKHRKYLLASDTEAAASALAQQRGGQGAELVRDIRTMPLAMARLERAIAGRELINQIKAMGQATGTVTANSIGGPGFFTLDHPAFTRFQPRFVEENGRTTPALDQNGDMVFDRVPIFISKEFEGPLKAVLSERSGTIYQGLMELKGKAMGLIMYSPMIHNAVEWGRALPVAPGKVMTFRIYFEGNRFKNDPSKMAQAISDGMVPIGGRGAMQDITGLMEQPELLPGRSLTAKLIGGALGLVHEGAGQAAKRGIDAAGDFWHNTLLWDRIGDLQAGLYNTVKTDLLAKGMDPTSAGALAAHFANRYAGALPNEAMSAMTRKIANIVLFSRSFTLGNLGVMKDIVSGMPKDVQSQILMASGELGLKAAQGVARRKALGAFIIDVGLMYAANSLLQNAFQAMQDDSDLGDIGRGYAERFHALMQKVHEHPLQVLNSPVAALESLLPNSENEPGKQNRIDMGPDEHGTHIYLRLPIGKVGEEFVEWPTSPLAMLLKKQGTMVRPLLETIKNDKGFGEPVYDAEAHGFVGAAKNVGKIVANFMSEQVPLDSAVAVKDWAQGKANSVDKMKAVGPLVGLTFSKGAPGGPAVGEMYATARQHQAKLLAEMPEIRRLLKLGEQDAAIEKMMELNMSPGEIRSMLNHQENPESRLSSQAFKRFQRHADEEAKQRMERHLETR